MALNTAGFYCGEDDTEWWQFGSDTQSSLLTYQVLYFSYFLCFDWK